MCDWHIRSCTMRDKKTYVVVIGYTYYFDCDHCFVDVYTYELYQDV